MSVVVAIEEAGPTRKLVTVEVPAPAVEAEMQRVTAEWGREIPLPGFRKGKAPRQLILKRFREEIEKEVIERLLPRYWKQAQAEAGIEVLLSPELEDVKLEPGAAMTFKAAVEVRPEIELGDLDGISLPDPSVEVDDDEVEEALDDLRRRHGDWVPVERAAARGDLVSIEIEDTTPSEDEAGEQSEPKVDTLSIEVGDPRVWEELSLAVTGLEAGQQSDFSRNLGSDDEPLRRNFRVKVTAVKERELPDADDELASAVGDFESIDELRDELRRHLGNEKRQARLQARERALLERLREMHPIAVSDRLVARETEMLMRNHAERMARQGVDLERAEIDWVKMRDDATPHAREAVHARLVLEAIAKQRGLEAGEQELEAALSDIARSQGATTAAVRRSLDEDGRLAGLRAQLTQEKVVRTLIGADAASDEAPETDSGVEGEVDEGDAGG